MIFFVSVLFGYPSNPKKNIEIKGKMNLSWFSRIPKYIYKKIVILDLET